MPSIEEIVAIEEIKQLKVRYLRCMDKNEWAEYEAVFSPDAEIESSEALTPRDFTGSLIYTDGNAPQPPDLAWCFTSPKEFVELRPDLDGASILHHSHMPEI